ncbi:hypothetical protein D9615_008233 [Tricholomella constricta]|uniref:Alpha/beta hydrolase fold-3 domain-containing protein n=1 Tax=Tricholomella constricta TaxID=117010 RepID=A0A8H5M072_9AGAR|nr:hypothetical protein D9615_008233 [Tricholomella constricta]
MEKVAEIESREIFDVIESTIGAFIPLLEERRAEIQEIPRKTFKYGPTDRHQLDVYYPIAPNPSGTTQILVWIYGGGFATGERQMKAPADLGYACVGAYFARRGFIVIIPDYRLSPETVFPGGAEDVRDSVLWAIKNPEHLTTSTTPNPDTKGIFLMGHSAGAVHAFTVLVLPETPESAIVRPSIAGAILCAGVQHYDGLGPDNLMLTCAVHYYAEGVEKNAPRELLRRASDATVAALPRTVLVVAEREPEWLLKVNDDFAEELEARTGVKPAKVVAKGHNHLSTNWALGTGQGETWAEDVIAWIKQDQ